MTLALRRPMDRVIHSVVAIVLMLALGASLSAGVKAVRGVIWDAPSHAMSPADTPAPATVEALRRLTPSFAALGNPVDLTPQCPPENFVEAIGAVFDDPGYDGAIVINCGLDIPEFGEGVVTAAARTGKPVTAYVLQTPRIEAALRDAGIPLLDSPERAVSAYAGGVP